MKKPFFLTIGLAAVCWWASSDAWARGGRAGGGGGGGRGGFSGGGGMRSAGGGGMRSGGASGYRGAGGGSYRGAHGAGRTPSMSRPTGLPSSLSRPSGGGSRPASSRPQFGNLPTPGARPGGARPGTGAIASRPAASRPTAGTRPAGGARPSTRDLQNFLDLPTTGGGLAGAGRPSTRPASPGVGLAGGALAGGAAAAFLNEHPAEGIAGAGRPGGGEIATNLPARPGTGGRPDGGLRPGGDRPDAGLPGRPGDRPFRPGDRDFVQNRPGHIRGREQWRDWRQDHRDDIRDYWRNHAAGHRDWYGDEWWLHNHLRDIYYPRFNYWAWAAWPAVTGWVDYGWTEPVYYNYGENVYYQDGSVYYGDQPVATEEEYAQQAEAIATSVPDTQPAAEDWMPLGVFALTHDGEPSGAEPTLYLQLAVSKQGILSGTLQNTATDAAQQIEGMVDKQTQRAAWTAAGKARPLMETGVSNLTQDMTPALVHFADGTTQQWLMVRMDKPGTTEGTAPTPPSPPAEP